MPDSAPLPSSSLASVVPQVTTGAFPSSRKTYAMGKQHGDLRVAMREIDLTPSANEPPARVYDTSGPYSDPDVVRVGDDYYIATSTFEWFPGVQIHHSRDLVHWSLLTRPLRRASQ